MAWSVISDLVLQVGKPVRALTLRLLRDNITALANGDAGAPRIQRAALQPYLIDADKIAGGAVSAWQLAAGWGERDWVMARFADMQYANVGAPVLALRVVNNSVTHGSFYAGSDLRISSAEYASGVLNIGSSGGSLPGTWRALGENNSSVGHCLTMFVRVA